MKILFVVGGHEEFSLQISNMNTMQTPVIEARKLEKKSEEIVFPLLKALVRLGLEYCLILDFNGMQQFTFL